LDENPSAQETQAGANDPSPEADKSLPEGIQKRIGQLVGEREAERRRAAQLEAQLQQAIASASQSTEAMARMAERMATPVQQAPAEPEIEIDPEEAKKFAYMAKKMYGPVIAEMEGIKRAIHETRVELAANEGSRKVANYGLSQEQLNKARSIFDKMHSRGVQEWSMQDSVRLILGEATEGQLEKNRNSQANRQRMNGTHTIPFQAGVPGVGGGPSVSGEGPEPLPDNFGALSPKEQMKLLKKRDVLNKPI
jgi:hypothetical protein